MARVAVCAPRLATAAGGRSLYRRSGGHSRQLGWDAPLFRSPVKTPPAYYTDAARRPVRGTAEDSGQQERTERLCRVSAESDPGPSRPPLMPARERRGDFRSHRTLVVPADCRSGDWRAFSGRIIPRISSARRPRRNRLYPYNLETGDGYNFQAPLVTVTRRTTSSRALRSPPVAIRHAATWHQRTTTVDQRFRFTDNDRRASTPLQTGRGVLAVFSLRLATSSPR
jgi:hypothetical protein